MIEESKRIELWGAFSVRDHLRRRPFVAEVLLYDRLMIPRPPTLEEEQPEPKEESQLTRWMRSGWKPGRLKNALDILRERELAIELPWAEQARRDWSDLYHGSDFAQIGGKRSEIVNMARAEIEMAKATMPNQAAFVATGGLIATYVAGEVQHPLAQRLVALARTPGVPIEPVIAYRSYKEFQHEQSVKKVKFDPTAERPYAMFGWEFFVPEDSDKTDWQLLREACQLASRDDFRETRQSFHYWLKHMHEGNVDPETARDDMLKRLREYRAVIRGSRMKTIPRYVAKVAPVLAPLAHLVLPETYAIGGDAAAGGASLIVEWLLPEKKSDHHARPAALVHQARRFFDRRD